MESSHRIVDTSWFSTLEDALVELDPRRTYDELAERFFSAPEEVDPPLEHLILQSLLVRMAGLHRGIWRGIADDNPYAVWPLLRSFFELEVTMLYLSRYPEPLGGLSASRSKSNPDAALLPKMSRRIAAVRDLIPSGENAYRELSDLTHGGMLATWSAHTPEQADDGLNLHWSSHPRFRPEQVPIAATQLRELRDGSTFAFTLLAEVSLSG